eukprot:41992-Rhodomonas_salina.1
MLAKRKFHTAKVHEKLGKAPTGLLELGDEGCERRRCCCSLGLFQKERESVSVSVSVSVSMSASASVSVSVFVVCLTSPHTPPLQVFIDNAFRRADNGTGAINFTFSPVPDSLINNGAFANFVTLGVLAGPPVLHTR